MFSGFFFAKSVSEGGIPLWNMANFRWQSKDQEVFKKARHLFKKEQGLFFI